MVHIYIYTYRFDTSDQRKPQGYISHIVLTTIAFDAEAGTKHHSLWLLLKVLHYGFE